jgi:hypothetical protein
MVSSTIATPEASSAAPGPAATESICAIRSSALPSPGIASATMSLTMPQEAPPARPKQRMPEMVCPSMPCRASSAISRACIALFSEVPAGCGFSGPNNRLNESIVRPAENSLTGASARNGAGSGTAYSARNHAATARRPSNQTRNPAIMGKAVPGSVHRSMEHRPGKAPLEVSRSSVQPSLRNSVTGAALSPTEGEPERVGTFFAFGGARCIPLHRAFASVIARFRGNIDF